MQLAVLFRMISLFLWVLILGVMDVTNKFIFERYQSALKHDTIDTYNIISTQQSLQLVHNLQNWDT